MKKIMFASFWASIVLIIIGTFVHRFSDALIGTFPLLVLWALYIGVISFALSAGAYLIQKRNLARARTGWEAFWALIIWLYNIFICGYLLAYVFLYVIDRVPNDRYNQYMILFGVALGFLWKFLVTRRPGRRFVPRKNIMAS